MKNQITAWALCWPNDERPLLFNTLENAEENRAWFSKNYKKDRNGNPRGEPFIVELAPKTEAPDLLEAIKINLELLENIEPFRGQEALLMGTIAMNREIIAKATGEKA